jgi:hypothetical protein
MSLIAEANALKVRSRRFKAVRAEEIEIAPHFGERSVGQVRFWIALWFRVAVPVTLTSTMAIAVAMLAVKHLAASSCQYEYGIFLAKIEQLLPARQGIPA